MFKLLIMLYIFSIVKLVKFSFSMLPDVLFLVNKDYQYTRRNIADEKYVTPARHFNVLSVT